MVRKIYRRAVFIVVYRKTRNLFGKKIIKYLLLQRKKHWNGWEFPKGGVEPNESLVETARREIFEECGQIGKTLKKYDLSGKYLYSKPLKDRKSFVGQTYVLFSAEVKSLRVKVDTAEHSAYRWCSFAKAVKMLTWSNQIDSLKKVNKDLLNGL